MGSSSIVEAINPTADSRPSWHEHFMGLAEYISTRATCQRLRVGCVFTKDQRVLVTGYNGALAGRKHCDEIGCLLHENHCVRASHAEQNAVASAAKHGVSLEDSYLYVNYLPCVSCFKLVLAAGVSRVYYRHQYGTADMNMYATLQGMSRLEQLK